MTIPVRTRHGVINMRATVPQLEAALSASRSLNARPSGSAPTGIATGAGSECYPVSYQGSTWYAGWCDLEVYLDATSCDPMGCEDADRLTASINTNPGAFSSYSPYKILNVVAPGYSSVFTDVHINWNTLCYASLRECGHGTTGNVPPSSSGKMYPTSDVDLHGDEITHLYYLWALFIPNGSNYSSHAQTGTATCKPASSGSNQCLYPPIVATRHPERMGS